MSRILLFVAPSTTDPQALEKQTIVKQECAGAGWIAATPQYDSATATFSLEQTLADMKAAALIFADVSFERPSCYYELGCAEALERPVVVVAQTGTEIYQTSHRQDVISYAGTAEFRRVLKQALAEFCDASRHNSST